MLTKKRSRIADVTKKGVVKVDVSTESIGRAPVLVASVFRILFHMFSHFVFMRKYLSGDLNKIQALFSFSVSDFETCLGFKIRSRAIGKIQKCAFLLKSDSLCLMLGRIDA